MASTGVSQAPSAGSSPVVASNEIWYHKGMSCGDKEYHKAYGQRHYLDNKDRYHAARDRQQKRARKVLLELKAGGCARCGYNDCASALDFHHVSHDKEMTLSRAIKYGWGEKRIRIEAKKCIVLCANCHREQHHCTKKLDTTPAVVV